MEPESQGSTCSPGMCWIYEFCILEVRVKKGTSLVAQWLRFHAPNAGGPSLICGQGIRPHILQLKVPLACIILKQSVFQTVCEAIYQFIITSHAHGIDKSIREHVILHNDSIPVHLQAISGESERQLTKAKALLELAPFSVFGIQLDVGI